MKPCPKCNDKRAQWFSPTFWTCPTCDAPAVPKPVDPEKTLPLPNPFDPHDESLWQEYYFIAMNSCPSKSVAAGLVAYKHAKHVPGTQYIVCAVQVFPGVSIANLDSKRVEISGRINVTLFDRSNCP